MALSPNEELFQAVKELQPEKIMEALKNGANPYVKIAGPDVSPGKSALELSMEPNGLTSMFDNTSKFAQRLQNSFEKMVDVEPQDNDQRQEVVHAQIKAVAENVRSLQTYELMDKQAQDRKINLSSNAKNWLMAERYRDATVNMSIIESAGWKAAVDHMVPEDLRSHHNSATNAIDHAKHLAQKSIELMHLNPNGEISVKQNLHPNPTPYALPTLQFGTQKAPEGTGSFNDDNHFPQPVANFAASKAAQEAKPAPDQAPAPTRQFQ